MGFGELKNIRKPGSRNRFADLAVGPLETRNLQAPEVAPAPDPDPEPEDLAGQAAGGGESAVSKAAVSPVVSKPAELPPMRPAAPAAARTPDPVQEGRVDGRSLRATGRTEQLNIKVRPDIKAKFLRHAQSQGKIAAVLLEQWVESLPE